MNENLHKVVGIDLGTTYSTVAAYNKVTDVTEAIRNTADGNSLTTASVISLDPVTRKAVVGMWAKRNGAVDRANTVMEIKREMGEEFSKETLDHFGAARTGLCVGDPVKVHFAGHWMLPQEISAFTLMRMKQVAEAEIGEEIRDAVVTVPAYFTEKQKKATREAALLAGLYPRQLIAEPTAAAICYAVDKQEPEKKIYLVYDLGGGTFDVSIIELEGQKVDVIATSGDMRLGGGNFDDAITAYVVDQLLHQYQIDFRNLPPERASQEQKLIKLLAEEAKIRLSSVTETLVDLKDRFPQYQPQISITRKKYEELIDGYLKKSLTCVENAINRAAGKGVKRDDISAILLVGGSSKMPCAKSLLLEFFQKGEDFVKDDANPDLMVARGAAILARNFTPSPPPFDIRRPVDNTLVSTQVEDQVQVRLITEHSLGVEVQNRQFNKIIDQGTNIPVEVTRAEYTNAGPTTDIIVNVFQGEGQLVDTCTQIGMLHLGPIEPLPAYQHQFSVTFSLDVSGLLTMTVHHLNAKPGAKRDWEARFEQKTGVGGVEALAAMHERLRNLFAGTASSITPPSPPPPGQTAVAPPQYPPYMGMPAAPYGYPQPPGPYPPQPMPAYPADAMARGPAGTPVPPVPGATPQGHGPGSAMPQPPWPYPPVQRPDAGQQPPLAPTPSPAVAPAPAIVEPMVDIPAEFLEFKTLVRRARKHLERSPVQQLLDAFNAFATALNEGKSGKELESLGDALADAYDDARKQTF